MDYNGKVNLERQKKSDQVLLFANFSDLSESPFMNSKKTEEYRCAF